MKHSIVVVCFVFVFNLFGEHSIYGYQVRSAPLLTERPNWLQVCPRNDPNINECFKEIFVNMFPYLAEGIPEMKIDPFEPLPLTKVSVTKGAGPVTLTGSLYDLLVMGPSKAVPTYATVDLDTKKFNFGLDLPILDIKSKYNLTGKILVLPLVGNGNCELKLKDVKTQVLTKFSFQETDGKEIVHFDTMKVMFKVKGMRVHFDNLFNGNKVLGLTMNNFLNQNALEVIAELEENIGENLAVIFLDLINNIFSKMPTYLWFPQTGDTKEPELPLNATSKE